MNNKKSGAVLMNMVPFVLCHSKKYPCHIGEEIEKMQVKDTFLTLESTSEKVSQ